MEEIKKKNSDARIRANNKYNKKNYTRTPISLRHNEMNVLNAHCEKHGYSKNGFIVQAIKEKIERDTGKSFDEFLKEQQQEQDPDEPKDTKEPKSPERPEVFKLDQ